MDIISLFPHWRASLFPVRKSTFSVILRHNKVYFQWGHRMPYSPQSLHNSVSTAYGRFSRSLLLIFQCLSKSNKFLRLWLLIYRDNPFMLRRILKFSENRSTLTQSLCVLTLLPMFYKFSKLAAMPKIKHAWAITNEEGQAVVKNPISCPAVSGQCLVGPVIKMSTTLGNHLVECGCLLRTLRQMKHDYQNLIVFTLKGITSSTLVTFCSL